MPFLQSRLHQSVIGGNRSRGNDPVADKGSVEDRRGRCELSVHPLENVEEIEGENVSHGNNTVWKPAYDRAGSVGDIEVAWENELNRIMSTIRGGEERARRECDEKIKEEKNVLMEKRIRTLKEK